MMSRILKNVHASAKRLRDARYMDAITMREFDALCVPELHDYSPADVGRIRENTKASQVVLRPC